MNLNSIETLILQTASDFGITVFTILVSVIGLAVAYLAFRFGWNSLQSGFFGFSVGGRNFGYQRGGKFWFNEKNPF